MTTEDEATLLLSRRVNELAFENKRLRNELERVRTELSTEHKSIAGWSVAWEPPPGFESGHACDVLQKHADATGEYASMYFNGVKATAHPGGKSDDVFTQIAKQLG